MHKCNPKGSLAEVWRNRTSDDSEFLQEISLEGCFVRARGFSPTLNFTWSVVWHGKLLCWTESWKTEALVGLTQPLNLSHDLIFLCLQLQRSNYSDSGWLYLLLLADIERSSCDWRLMCLWKTSPEPDLGEVFLLLLRMDLALFSSAVHQLCPVGCSFYKYQFFFLQARSVNCINNTPLPWQYSDSWKMDWCGNTSAAVSKLQKVLQKDSLLRAAEFWSLWRYLIFLGTLPEIRPFWTCWSGIFVLYHRIHDISTCGSNVNK